MSSWKGIQSSSYPGPGNSIFPSLEKHPFLFTKQTNEHTGSHTPVKTYYGLFCILGLKKWDVEQLL